MTAGPGLRKLLLTVHVTASVGWVGAILTYLAINVVALTSNDAAQARGAYQLLEPVLQYVIAPMAVTSLITGIVMGLVTRWGLLRHRWVATSLWLTTLAVALLFVHMSTEVADLAAAAADPATNLATDPATERADLPNTIAGLLLVAIPLVLNIYKPRGLTRRGRRHQNGATTPLRSATA
ncbi:DUF2269 family protein [Nocardioides sp. BYT-33-1]|uniref:DUF2269 family protein n=1 Tax=Nocardioides sp. BYT-33-1 TaxID=3416952 RepID=UPI003F53705C